MKFYGKNSITSIHLSGNKTEPRSKLQMKFDQNAHLLMVERFPEAQMALKHANYFFYLLPFPPKKLIGSYSGIKDDNINGR